MNYQEALAYIYSLSDYERGDRYTRNREENLARESRLLELLGNPQNCYTSTLIAGTKGKGSTAAFIERVLREAGIRTGLYTQPDLHTFRGRMRVNGRLISEEEVADLLPEVRSAAEGIRERREFDQLNTYQVATALTFLYFCRRQIQHAVLEVGLGGRLDATNVTHPLVSVITSISYDHMEFLGDTLTKIATEKAGIIKPNGIVVTSAQAPEALLAIAAVCQRQHARLIRIGAVEVQIGRIAQPTQGRIDRCDSAGERHRRVGSPVANAEAKAGESCKRQRAVTDAQRHRLIAAADVRISNRDRVAVGRREDERSVFVDTLCRRNRVDRRVENRLRVGPRGFDDLA